jgi:hypothetical protein
MSDVGTALPRPAAVQASARDGGVQNRIAELKVSGHLMTLDTGLFCVFQAPGSAVANERSGLPGVRISLPPGAAGRPEAITISTFRDDGWMSGRDSAALVRVIDGPAQVLVTVYQSPTAPPEAAPRLQVMRIGADPAVETAARGAAADQAAPPAIVPADAEIVVHVQRSGDVAGSIGDWIGVRGSRQWIEGFSVRPGDAVKPADIEYQAVLGRGWLSPWIEGGKFCGSRGMALPLLGLKLRLKGNAAKTHECSYSATFVDGSSVGPVPGGEACEAETLAALEAFQVVIGRRGSRAGQRGARGQAGQPDADEPPAARPAKRARRAR